MSTKSYQMFVRGKEQISRAFLLLHTCASRANWLGKKLWDALKSKKEILTDEQLVAFLETTADKSVADMMRNWDKEAVK